MSKENLNLIKILITKTYGTVQRYKIDATFAYLYHDKELSVVELGKFVRISDHFIQIDRNHYFIKFSFTHLDDAFKASENLLFRIDNYFNDSNSYIVLDTFDTSKSADIVLHRLIQILDETKKHSYSRIENEEIFNKII